MIGPETFLFGSFMFFYGIGRASFISYPSSGFGNGTYFHMEEDHFILGRFGFHFVARFGSFSVVDKDTFGLRTRYNVRSPYPPPKDGD